MEVESHRQKQVLHKMTSFAELSTNHTNRAGSVTIGTQKGPLNNTNNNRMTCSTVKSTYKHEFQSMATDVLISVYLISTAVANKAKSKFYDDDLPGLENVSFDR
jgi:hypothetical protein